MAQEISLASKTKEEPQPEEHGWPREAGKSKQKLGSILVRPMSDSSPPKLYDNTLMLF